MLRQRVPAIDNLYATWPDTPPLYHVTQLIQGISPAPPPRQARHSVELGQLSCLKADPPANVPPRDPTAPSCPTVDYVVERSDFIERETGHTMHFAVRRRPLRTTAILTQLKPCTRRRSFEFASSRCSSRVPGGSALRRPQSLRRDTTSSHSSSRRVSLPNRRSTPRDLPNSPLGTRQSNRSHRRFGTVLIRSRSRSMASTLKRSATSGLGLARSTSRTSVAPPSTSTLTSSSRTTRLS